MKSALPGGGVSVRLSGAGRKRRKNAVVKVLSGTPRSEESSTKRSSDRASAEVEEEVEDLAAASAMELDGREAVASADANSFDIFA